MPRGPRLDAPGAVHHVMARGIERRKIFRSDHDRTDLLKRIGQVAEETSTPVYAWALLPNHFHLLLRTGNVPLSTVMRRVLTGYVVSFNRRYNRNGHLLQNRFKSILVEEEAYLLELVRYLHLNPVRARLVTAPAELDRYPWTGHAVLVGYRSCDFQDTDFILALFGNGRERARRAYRAFIEEGFFQGRRDELTGGGLRRSLGGWDKTDLLKRGRERWAFDERVLGCSDFVAQIHAQIDTGRPPLFEPAPSQQLPEVLEKIANRFRVSPAEITSRSLRRQAIAARAVLSCLAVQHFGLSARAAAHRLGLSDDSVLRGLRVADLVFAQNGCTPEDFLS